MSVYLTLYIVPQQPQKNIIIIATDISINIGIEAKTPKIINASRVIVIFKFKLYTKYTTPDILPTDKKKIDGNKNQHNGQQNVEQE